MQFGEELARNARGLILDVACGYGRNAAYIASFGVNVVCIDNDTAALDHIMTLPEARRLTAIKLHLLDDPWPFTYESVGAIVNVHYYRPTLLGRFMESLRPGGYLYLETIGGQGHNYRELPPRRFIRDQLAEWFDVRYYKENQVGPERCDAVSVKLFAIKR
jgi:SAM-dependent methyltransferase